MSEGENRARAHVLVRGRVQGVYFRASAVYEAQNLGLTGWVRNCADGSVEALAEGDRNKMEEWIAWCRRGPSGARVEKVEIQWLPYTGEFAAFQIKR
ncbi:MAG TPA: acylphosphatase [Candidatus Binatia bacterium]|nr:acylphosphatase [Candidatus Binatia bacterium]